MMETTLDKFGRVLIPKEVRDDLGLKPGAVLEIEELEETILLKPKNDEPHVVLKDGVLVFSGAATGDVAGAIHTHREERLKKVTRRTRK
jgi:AbrB family looped-hinge helix DNA binding protein